jgi:hypothetical protein
MPLVDDTPGGLAMPRSRSESKIWPVTPSRRRGAGAPSMRGSDSEQPASVTPDWFGAGAFKLTEPT